MTTEHYDVIIIGTGAGGGTLAHKLAPSGKRILLLERGGYLAREPETGTAARSYQRPLPVRRGLVRQGASRCVPGRAGRRRGSAASGTGRPGRPAGGFRPAQSGR
jgi:choline dehydrogenase-like flavoprotein